MTRKSRIAFKHVNVSERVVTETRTLVPAVTFIRRVDVPSEDITIVRRVQPAAFWEEFDDRTLGDLVGTGLLGQ